MSSASSNAARMRRMRYRRAMGIRVLPVEVSIDVVEVLVEKEYLRADEVRDRERVAEATSRFLEAMADGVTRNGTILDGW